MRKQLFLIIWVVTLSTIKLYAQDNPVESIVINATKSIIAKDFKPNELHDYVRVDNELITFINGNFSGIKRKECIAICPMNRLTGTAGAYQKFIILFYKNEAGNWTKGNFHVLEQEIETKDLNNDKLPELICKSGYSWQGEDGNSTTIYQLRGDSIKKIYSNESVDHEIMYIEYGEIVSKNYEISFIDLNNDGIIEINENLEIRILTKKSENYEENETKSIKTSRTLKLIDNKYK